MFKIAYNRKILISYFLMEVFLLFKAKSLRDLFVKNVFYKAETARSVFKKKRKTFTCKPC